MTETMEFGPIDVLFDDRVLRPRPWTLAQSHWAAELAESAPAGPILELCSGAGHIGLAAALESRRDLVMVDANPRACELSRLNARAAGVTAEIIEGRLEMALAPDRLFGVIIADPPWVRTTEIATFPEDPVLAIDGGPDGLALARACLAVIGDHLAPGGAGVLQVGSVDQVTDLAGDVSAAGLRVAGTRTEEGGVLVHLTHA